MITLRAPYPNVQTVSRLPNPVLGDSETPKDTVQLRRAMDGTTYTYVRRTGDRRELDFEIPLTRMKALEFLAFIRSYHASVIHLTDHLGQEWVGNITTDVVDFTNSSRAPDKPGGEMTSVRFQFEGVLQ